MKPRPFTSEEVTTQFLEHIKQLKNYWLKQGKDKEDTVDGIIFSILVMLDGGSMGLPGFSVKPDPHPSDKEYHIENGNNYYSSKTDISGCLHELWGKVDPHKEK